MRVVPGEQTSYGIVLALPGVNRIFLHCPGATDTFAADDVDLDLAARARLFYFGYPPLMARMYADGGALARLFESVKSLGVTTAPAPGPAGPGRGRGPSRLEGHPPGDPSPRGLVRPLRGGADLHDPPPGPTR